MDGDTRPDDNLYTVSLICLDVTTGKIRWYYHQMPHDLWGYDVASLTVLFYYVHNGKTIPAVGQPSKTGWYFIHNRLNGELLRRSEAFIPHQNIFATPVPEGITIAPGPLSAKAGALSAPTPPISDQIDGVQYVAVAAGGNQLFGFKQGDTLQVFALPRNDIRGR